jgi:hypothetical protein
MHPTGAVSRVPIDFDAQTALEAVNRALEALLDEPEYRVFGLIGSGLQRKRGETTLARQDVFSSIDRRRSEQLLDRVRGIVHEVDAEGSILSVEDTGKDIEIVARASETAGANAFDKGDGLSFLNDELSLRLAERRSLICGDTGSDLPMVRRCLELGGSPKVIFVTTDTELIEAVRATGADAHFVSTPDVLVAALGMLGEQGWQ